jgi:hypothetical protein
VRLKSNVHVALGTTTGSTGFDCPKDGDGVLLGAT